MALPLKYSLRNLWRRPGRTLLTVSGIGIVVFAAVIMGAFSRGIQARLKNTGEAQNLLVISRKGENLMFSSLEADELVELNAVPNVAVGATGEPLISPEIMDMAPVEVGGVRGQLNIRGVRPLAYQVHTCLHVQAGRLPERAYEILVGCTAHVRLGVPSEALAPGQTIRLYGQDWTVCGRFTAAGTLFESEAWVEDQQQQTALRRRTHSFAVLRMETPEQVSAALPLFAQSGALEKYFKGWPEPAYYREYLESLSWVYWLSLLMVLAVTLAGVLIGVNTMYTAVLNRIREIATQRVLGFARFDILKGLLFESLVVALLAGAAGVFAAFALNDLQFKFSQGVFRLAVDPMVMAAGLAQAVLIGVVGAALPSYKGLKLTIVDALKYRNG